MSDTLTEQLNEKAADYDDIMKDMENLRREHPKVFELLDALVEERDQTLAQMKALASTFQLPVGAKNVTLDCGFKIQRTLKARTMDANIVNAMLKELKNAGLIKPPTFAQVEKAVEAGKLTADALAFAKKTKQDADLSVGVDYTVSVKAPK